LDPPFALLPEFRFRRGETGPPRDEETATSVECKRSASPHDFQQLVQTIAVARLSQFKLRRCEASIRARIHIMKGPLCCLVCRVIFANCEADCLGDMPLPRFHRRQESSETEPHTEAACADSARRQRFHAQRAGKKRIAAHSRSDGPASSSHSISSIVPLMTLRNPSTAAL